MNTRMMGCKYGESEGCGSFFCRKVGGGKREGKNEEKATWAEIEAAVDEQMNQVPTRCATRWGESKKQLSWLA